LISRIWRILPGPLSVRITAAIVLTGIVLVALHFIYSWLGIVLLDQGGTVG
jgi:hypothetical protein